MAIPRHPKRIDQGRLSVANASNFSAIIRLLRSRLRPPWPDCTDAPR